MSEETPEYEIEQVLETIEQHTIMFYGKPLVAIRLPDGTPAVVFNQLCENMGLERTAQVRRVRRKKATAKGFYSVRIETPNRGQQVVNALTLQVTPGWLFGIDANRAAPEVRADIERYQDECMDVLYQWASTPRIEAPAALVPAEQIVKPESPGQGASPQEWRDYYQRMIEFLDWQESIEIWRNSIDTRLGNLEAVIPDILQRLPPPTITPAHQNMVKYYISQLHTATGKPFATLYSALYTAFNVPRYEELREADWPKVERWFKRQLPGQGDQPKQDRLF